MDRMKLGMQPGNPAKNQTLLVVILLVVVVGIISLKAIDEGWFAPREPLDLSSAPILLLFNRHKGCECELAVYQAADKQIKGWSEDGRNGMKIIYIDLDRRPDLGKQFDIMRAPSLLLVDKEGTIIFGQKESKSDTTPLDLIAFEKVIQELTNGT